MLASARRLTLSCATGSSPRLLATALIHRRRRGAGIDGPLLLRQQQHHLGAPGASTASHPSIHSLPRFYSSTTNTSSSSTQSDQAQEAKQSSSSSKSSSSSDKQQGSDDGAKKQSSWSAIKRLLSLGRPELRLILFSLGALGINAATNLIFPAGMGRIIDSVAGDTSHHTDEERAASKSRLWLVSGLLLGAFAVGSLAMFTRVSTLNVASERIVARLRKQLFGSVIRQDVEFFDRTRTGELINRLSADTAVISRALTDNIASGARRVVEGLGGVAILFYLTPSLTLVMLSVVPPVALGAVAYGRFVKKLSSKVQDSLAAATSMAEDRVSQIRTVKVFAREEHEDSNYGKQIDEAYKLGAKAGVMSGVWYGSVGIAANIAMLSVLTYGGNLVIDNQLTVGELTSFLLYSVYVAFALSGTATFYADFMRGVGASQRVFELLDSTPKIRNKCGLVPSSIKGDIEFRDVRFSYPTRPEGSIMEGLNLKIPAGTSLAIVGSSGSGKSTIAALLVRFYDPTSGSILLDGNDISTLDPQWLRSQIGMVSQEPALFHGSIRDNILYGAGDAHEAEIEDARIELAARKANAHQFIEGFANGYNTLVGERGITLSGGQRQRVAIARALVKEPAILLLDEATSALDVESEHLVQSAMESLMNQRTVTTVIIAHRLSTVKSADCIAVLHEGKIVETGKHEELLARNGIYASLVSRQMQ